MSDQDALDVIRMAGERYINEGEARVFLDELREAGWDVTRQCGGPITQEHLDAEVEDAVQRELAACAGHDRPLLGLATTQQLIEELQARGDVDSVVRQTEERGVAGAQLASVMGLLLSALLPEQLSHSTVHGDAPLPTPAPPQTVCPNPACRASNWVPVRLHGPDSPRRRQCVPCGRIYPGAIDENDAVAG